MSVPTYILAASPVGFWRFEETSGTSAADSAGSNTGTHNGTVTVNQDGIDVGTKSVTYDGDDFTSVGTLGTFGSGLGSGFTIAYWVKTTNTQLRNICGVIHTGDKNGFTLRVNANLANVTTTDYVRFIVGSNDASPKYLVASAQCAGMTDGDWHLIVVTCVPSTNTVAVYFDGVSQTVSYGTANGPSVFADWTQPLYIGSHNQVGTSTLPVIATVDEFAIFAGAKDATFAAELYDEWPADTTAPTVPVLDTPVAGDTEVTLEWSASTDAVGVTGYKYRVDEGTAVDVGDVLTVDVTGLTNGTEYSFQVQAYDAAGNHSDWSTAATATPAAAVPVPTGLAAVAGVEQITWSWNAVE